MELIIIAMNEIDAVVFQLQRCSLGSDLLRNVLKLIELVGRSSGVLVTVFSEAFSEV